MRRRRRTATRSLSLFAAVTIVVALVIAAVAVAEDDGRPTTGADDPEAAVVALRDAATSLDIDAVLALMPPGEADELRQPLHRLAGALEARGIGRPTWIRDAVPDVVATNVEELDDEEGLARVAIRYAGDDFDHHAVARRVDDRWYVSPWSTLLEGELRLEGEERRPDGPVEPRGAATPTDAVDGLLAAAGQQDMGATLALLDPAGAAAFQRHAAQLGDGDSALAGIGNELLFHVGNPLMMFLSDHPTTVTLGRTTEERAGDDRRFLVAHDAESRSADQSLAYEDGCSRVTAGQPDPPRCRKVESGFDISPEIDPPLVGMLPWPLLPLYAFSFEEYEVASDAGYLVVRRDGRWYVQLMASRIMNAALAVEALDPAQAEELRACIAGGFDPIGAECSDVPTPDER